MFEKISASNNLTKQIATVKMCAKMTSKYSTLLCSRVIFERQCKVFTWNSAMIEANIIDFHF